jgi:Putative MetA-pathway of phenol degradation
MKQAALLSASLAVLPALPIAPPAMAGVLETLAGDRLTGEIEAVDGHMVRFLHAGGRRISIALDRIARLDSAVPLVVHLLNGDRMVGRIEFRSPGAWRIHSESLGVQTVRPAEIAAVIQSGAAGPGSSPAAGVALAPAVSSAASRPAVRPDPVLRTRPDAGPNRDGHAPPAARATAQLAAVAGRGNRTETSTPSAPALGPNGQAPAPPSDQAASDAPELLFLREQAVLLQPGQVEADVQLSYIRNDSGIQKDRAFALDTALRLGLGAGFEGFFAVPLQWRRRQTNIGDQSFIDERFGVGDLQFGLKYSLLTEARYRPAMVLGLSGTAPIGESPYFAPRPDLPVADIRNPLINAIGSGHWSIDAGVTLIKSLDPIVLFGGFDYIHSFPAEHFSVDIEPGDRFLGRAGLGFAIDHRSTLGAQVIAQGQRPWRFNGTELLRTENFPITTRLSYTYRFADQNVIEPSVSFGLTDDATDAILGLGFSYRF